MSSTLPIHTNPLVFFMHCDFASSTNDVTGGQMSGVLRASLSSYFSSVLPPFRHIYAFSLVLVLLESENVVVEVELKLLVAVILSIKSISI